jgi:hypothetical protein
VNPDNKSIAAASITKRNVTARPSLLPCIFYFAFSADHIDFVAASLATYFHEDLGLSPAATIITAMGNRDVTLREAKRDR